MKVQLVFARKGIQNLKCCVIPVKSLVQKRVCSGRRASNEFV